MDNCTYRPELPQEDHTIKSPDSKQSEYKSQLCMSKHQFIAKGKLKCAA